MTSSRNTRAGLFTIVLTIAVLVTFRSAVADWNDVPSGSMIPTLLVGDRIVVNKLAYSLRVPLTRVELARWSRPKRGDIVILFSPSDGRRMVKRVVGVPGDVLALRDNRLVVNGETAHYRATGPDDALRGAESSVGGNVLLAESIGGREHLLMLTPGVRSLSSFGPIRVPEGHYFMMGDNRDGSADSRYFGFVEERDIVGRAVAVAFSLDYDDHHRPRSDRFFAPLYPPAGR